MEEESLAVLEQIAGNNRPMPLEQMTRAEIQLLSAIKVKEQIKLLLERWQVSSTTIAQFLQHQPVKGFAGVKTDGSKPREVGVVFINWAATIIKPSNRPNQIAISPLSWEEYYLPRD